MDDRRKTNAGLRVDDQTSCDGKLTRFPLTSRYGNTIWCWRCTDCRAEWLLCPGNPHIIPHQLTYSLDY